MPATAFSDAELLDQARNGDEAAFTELYVRHQAAALRLASTYRRLGDPEDLVNQAFEQILSAVRRGSGPTDAFRAYLFVTLRRLAAEQAERPAGQPLDNVPEPVVAEAAEPEMARADRDIMNDAFESLPDRWQTVLWHSAVEGRAPRELASVLGVSPNAAAALGSASGGKGAWRRVHDLAPSAGSAGAAALLVAGLTVASMAVSRGDGPTDVAADAAGLGSSGFDGGRERAFQPDVGDDEPPADGVFTAVPFHAPVGFDSDSRRTMAGRVASTSVHGSMTTHCAESRRAPRPARCHARRRTLRPGAHRRHRHPRRQRLRVRRPRVWHHPRRLPGGRIPPLRRRPRRRWCHWPS
jgi:RNA polymerase sigma factor (sigma-70 family)